MSDDLNTRIATDTIHEKHQAKKFSRSICEVHGIVPDVQQISQADTPKIQRILNNFDLFVHQWLGSSADSINIPSNLIGENPLGESLFDRSTFLRSFLEIKGISSERSQHLVETIEKKLKSYSFPLSDSEIRKLFQKEMALLLDTAGPVCLIRDKPTLLMIIGAPGVGKTTFLLKLGERYSRELDKKVAFIPLDRPGHNSFFEYTNSNLIIAESIERSDLCRCIEAYKSCNLLLLEVSDGLQSDIQSLECINVWKREGMDVQVQIAVSAEFPLSEALEYIDNAKTLHPSALIITKVDQSISLGSLIDLVQQSKLPISYLLRKQDEAILLDIADSQEMAEAILTS